MWLGALRVFGTLLVALVAGLSFAHVLEAQAKRAYLPPLYIQLQKSLYVQWRPPQIGGFLEPAAIVAIGLLALFLWQQSRRGSEPVSSQQQQSAGADLFARWRLGGW